MQKSTFQPSRRSALGLLGATLILPRAAFGAEIATLSGHAFGTTWRLVTASDVDIARLRPMIEHLFGEVDRVFSPWRADSIIARFNASSTEAPISNAELANVTEAALTIARQSDGAFDPTVGPLVARWGFGPIHEGGAPDWRGLSADAEMIRKTRDDLTLDLCGIAKGWALDRAADRIEEAGVSSFLLEVGGEFIARGQHPNARDWRVAIDTPDASVGASPTIRLPSGAAVATSGLWTQSYRLDDRLYSHIIHTGTAAPVSGALRSVTVVAENAMSADGWATALCAAGAEAGPDLATSMNLAAFFLIEDGGVLRSVETGPIHEVLL
ncbi:FAD:protein FMN transferase [Gymnodinialimonas sp. 2305UL16-5]|uniref:FAD:protein FMN transferase n=1 Tax=Gymnodinialimonas mytili TaxID=3126503 RepID=UPI0030B6F6A8